MRVIAIEEHWTTAALDRVLRRQPPGRRDDSLAFNDRGDAMGRLLDLGEARVAEMDAAGVDLQVVSLAPPGTGGLPPAEAVALSREANDLASAAVREHPTRLRALSSLPTSDPDAAGAELERTAGLVGHVGVMTYGRSGDRPLDDPAYDELLAAAAALGRPVFVHPQIPTPAVQDALYSGFDPTVDLSLATFGWGWHMEAGLAALRLILRGTFDRYPELQIVLGHWGEMLLFGLDRAGSLGHVASHLERPIAEYVRENVHITTSGMLVPRLLRSALEITTVDRVLLSGDTPFQPFSKQAIGAFLGELPNDRDRRLVAAGNAAALFGLDDATPATDPDDDDTKDPA